MKPIRLFWWSPARSLRLIKPELETNMPAWMRLGAQTRRPFNNFGDELSPLLVKAITGREVRWAPPRNADLVSVGSVIELAGRFPSSAAVWGTGLRGEIDAATAEKFRTNLGPMLAVRGPGTRRCLGLGLETPLGDPGLLSDRIVSRKRRVSQRQLLIPHFTTWNSSKGRTFLARAKSRGFSILPPSLHPLEVLNAISEASFVLSSSLHGVIVAHSLGIPTRLLAVGGKPGQEPNWKYVDYFASIGAQYEVEPWTVISDDVLLALSTEKASVSRETIMYKCQELGSGLEKALRSIV
jgi:hypothetical protein